MNENNYGTIPTIYRGIKYRSRLEAKVACFLDLNKIVYDYEPIDMAGHYIPDFVVDLHEPVLLECKPAVTFAEFRQACRRITRSGWTGPALVIGPRLLVDAEDRSDLTLVGSTHAELGGWTRIGRLKWPKVWGKYPFEDVRSNWTLASNTVAWRGY